VKCDPSIKAIIVKIDSTDHAFIVEDLDDEHLVIKENMVNVLKGKLDDVRSLALTWSCDPVFICLTDKR